MLREIILGSLAAAASITTLFGQSLNLEFSHAPGVEEGKSTAKGVLIDENGTLATVAVYGTDPEKAAYLGKDGKAVALKLLAHDTVSRITLLELPASVREGKTVVNQMGEGHALKPAAALSTTLDEQGGVSRLVSKVKRFDGKVLPLTLMRVIHSKEGVVPGTPLFDGKGSLVGFAHEGVVTQKNSTYALPVEVLQHIQTLHKQNGGDKTGTVKRCWVGLALDSMNDSPVVTGVRPESPARKAGLQKGDVLISVGGEEVGEYAEVVDAFYYLQPQKAVKFKILRGTEIKEFSVVPEVNPLFKGEE